MKAARPTQLFPVRSIATVLAGVLVAASPVWAQTTPPSGGQAAPPGVAGTPGVGVVAPQPTHPAPAFGFEPALPPEQGSPRQDDHGERARSVYQPAFVKGAVNTLRTSRTSGVRVGLSGWTAPRIPFDDREASGGPAFGLSFEWGTPMEPPAEPELR
jgi:hypothetical protein